MKEATSQLESSKISNVSSESLIKVGCRRVACDVDSVLIYGASWPLLGVQWSRDKV